MRDELIIEIGYEKLCFVLIPRKCLVLWVYATETAKHTQNSRFDWFLARKTLLFDWMLDMGEEEGYTYPKSEKSMVWLSDKYECDIKIRNKSWI